MLVGLQDLSNTFDWFHLHFLLPTGLTQGSADKSEKKIILFFCQIKTLILQEKKEE